MKLNWLLLITLACFTLPSLAEYNSSDFNWTYQCDYQKDSYAYQCYFGLDKFPQYVYFRFGFDIDWVITPRMERNDNEGISLSQSWSWEVNSFINGYFEMTLMNFIYYRAKAYLIPINAELYKFTYKKDFVNGPLCVSLESKLIVMQLYTELTQNVKQCAISLVDIAKSLAGLEDFWSSISECTFNSSYQESVRIPEKPWFSFFETGDFEYFNLCSGRE